MGSNQAAFLQYREFDETKLMEMALRRFASAWRSGRMIAFVGSGATAHLGYGSWDDLFTEYLNEVLKLISSNVVDISKDETAKTIITDIIDSHKNDLTKEPFDKRTLASIAEDVTHYVDGLGQNKAHELYDKLERAGADIFKFKEEEKADAVVVRALLNELGIERILTTNYDLEFERAMMLNDGEDANEYLGLGEGKCPKYPVIVDQQTHKLSRILPGGQSVVSDVFMRERTDRLIEFAVGSPEYEGQIFHLHGRADQPKSMVISLRDYDRLYRQSGIAKLPFEHALKILFAGNPIICVGLGMSEAELNQTLQEFVADHPRKNFAQLFVLASESNPKKRQLTRFNWKHKLGAYALFVEDLENWKSEYNGPKPNVISNAIKAMETIKKLISTHIDISDIDDGDTANEDFRNSLRQVNALINGKTYHQVPFPSRYQLKKERTEQNNRANDFAAQITYLSQKATTQLALNPIAAANNFRTLSDKLKKPGLSAINKSKGWNQSEPFSLWEVTCVPYTDDCPNTIDLLEKVKNASGSKTSSANVIFSTPGAGKGTLATKIIQQFKSEETLCDTRRAMLVNCNFAFDVDAMLSGLSGLVSNEPAEFKGLARSKIWKGEAKDFSFWEADTEVKALVVFNDFDRFFDRSGLPLSSEVDILCREIVRRLTMRPAPEADKKSVQFYWVFLGTERVQRYFEMIDREIPHRSQKLKMLREKNHKRSYFNSLKNPSILTKEYKWKRCVSDNLFIGCKDYQYLENIKAKYGVDFNNGMTEFQKGLIDHHKPREAADRRRAFMAAYLTPKALKKAVPCIDAALALDILTVMAFVGQTIEPSILAYAPRIRKLKKLKSGGDEKENEDTFYKRIMLTLKDLNKLGLVHKIANFTHVPDNDRYGLHRSVLAELRDRFGVPLGEAKLATAFNLSLYAAQPTDSYNPEADIHDELGKLVDYMVGAYKDDWRENLPDVQKALKATNRNEEKFVENQKKHKEFLRTQPHVSACLRTALGVLRSYYSTAALVTYDTTGRAGDYDEDRPGPLTEHCERLERLLWATEDTLKARVKYFNFIGPRTEKEAFYSTSPDYTPPPFYPDDLVWLHNERGVAKLMQGDLYEARASFDEASRLNKKFVEFDYKGPNWVRLNLNQLALDFERGRLSQARSRIDSIITAIGGHDKLHSITTHYGKESKPGEEGSKLRTVVSKSHTHDELLTVGLATGYRALIDFLGGRLETARRRFISAINILREINEQRAYAMFSLHYAALLNSLRDTKGAMIKTETAIAALQSSQQRDVASLGQIKEVWLSQWDKDGLPQKEHLRNLNAILEYSASADMHRVRVEARATLAKLKVKSGDYDAALEHASDAMAVASRFGMSLRKIALRTLIGSILIKRGDQYSGHALIDQAIKEADRIGYQRAVEAAQDVRILEGRLIDVPDY